VLEDRGDGLGDVLVQQAAILDASLDYGVDGHALLLSSTFSRNGENIVRDPESSAV
jgi:hypothetical protein